VAHRDGGGLVVKQFRQLLSGCLVAHFPWCNDADQQTEACSKETQRGPQVRLLRSFEHTAFRLELQRSYSVPAEAERVSRFLAGDLTPPTDMPAAQAWFNQVAAQAAEGKRIERVRVQEEPPTPYQRWERWYGHWNTEAGESIRYMTRQRAHEVGLLPAAGDDDWWLSDSCRLMVMRFDNEGRRIETELVATPSESFRRARGGSGRPSQRPEHHLRPHRPGVDLNPLSLIG
jgi:hypothetical protein